MKSIGKLKISEALELLKPIATLYGLKLYKADEFNLARIILVNLYCQELVCEYYEEFVY
jgi:hypothetical protein